MRLRQWVVEHNEGQKWLSVCGWTTSQPAALHFNERREAENYLRKFAPAMQHHPIVEAQPDTSQGMIRQDAASIDYDPFASR